MKFRPLHWHIITGEYPPQHGGVADYTRLIAKGLADAGDSVQVWAPEAVGETPTDPGVTVHRPPGPFGLTAFRQWNVAFRSEKRPFRVLIQYTPQAYGMKGMNVPFSAWVASIRRLRPWVMFHEVAVDPGWTKRWTHNVLGLVTHLMAGLVARGAERCLISAPRWASMLRRVSWGSRFDWLPVPSNVATSSDPAAVARVRSLFAAGPDSLVLGHFGTFGALVTRDLGPCLASVLSRHPRWSALLVGRGSEEFAAQMNRDHPGLTAQIRAFGILPADAVAAHLKACDLLVQPYADGANSRRGSLMAGLALGLPIVSTHGATTERLWRRERMVAFATPGSSGLEQAVEQLADSADERRLLSERARVGYDKIFSVRHTIEFLRSRAR